MLFEAHKDLAQYKNMKSYKKIDRQGNVLEHWKLIDGKWKRVDKTGDVEELIAKLEALKTVLTNL